MRKLAERKRRVNAMHTRANTHPFERACVSACVSMECASTSRLRQIQRYEEGKKKNRVGYGVSREDETKSGVFVG